MTQAQRKGDVQSHDQSPAGTRGRGWDSCLQHACTLAGLGRYIARARKGSRKPLESGKLVGVSGRENEQGAWFLITDWAWVISVSFPAVAGEGMRSQRNAGPFVSKLKRGRVSQMRASGSKFKCFLEQVSEVSANPNLRVFLRGAR